MDKNDLFEYASRHKVRFPSRVGNITVENLWDLPLSHATKANLDEIALKLDEIVNKGERKSFVNESVASDVDNGVAFEIVKYVIAVRKGEQLEAKNFQAQRERRNVLYAEKQRRQLRKIETMTDEELEAQLNGLQPVARD